MKTRSLKPQSIRPALALTLTLSLSSVAMAEHLNPAGAYSEAKLSGAAATSAATSAAPAQATAASRAGSAAQPVIEASASARSTAGEVRHWVRSQLHTLRSYFGSDSTTPDAPTATAAAPAAVPAPVASAPAKSAGSGSAGAVPAARPFVAQSAIEQKLRAPSSLPTTQSPAVGIDAPGVTRKSSGVASYALETSPSIPRLALEKEEHYRADRYALEGKLQKVMDDRVVHELASPESISQSEIKALTTPRTPKVGEVAEVQNAVFGPKGKVEREKFDTLSFNQKTEAELQLKKFVPLTPDETMFLSGLLLYQQGQQCPSALGLFHKLSKVAGWQAESNYYLAMCSKKLHLQTDFHERAARVLETKDVYYSRKLLTEITDDVPYEVADDFGNALMKATTDPKVTENMKPEVMANVSFVLADYAVTSEHFKTALTWAKLVPPGHPKYLKAQFLLALAEYQAGSKENAAKIEDVIVNDKTIDKSKLEFQALVALNAARMNFQEQKFKAAHEYFARVYKDHPLWVESLTETGWAQLMDGDYEGAIGSMYSIQSPFFTAVYKPESYVIRTIGYLNLCQYGDAYKALSILEKDYRPYLDHMDKYITRATNKPAYYQTVKNFMAAPKNSTEIDGLPIQVVREMARHRDFTNLQKAFNRQIDERPNYTAVDNEVEKSLKTAQSQVNSVRKQADDLRKRIALAAARHDRGNVATLSSTLEYTLGRLNDAFFKVDLYAAAKAGMDEYRREVVGGADKRIVQMKGDIEHLLANRLLRMKVDLARILDNNELLRYEVFSGSGENIRFQVAGGEVGNRVPASIIPKSKSLQWETNGEYWEDEIGNYRSGLKNNCPKTQRAQASLDGGGK